MIAWLRANVAGIRSDEITKRFNAFFGTEYPQSSIRATLKNHKISSGFDGRFKKGHTPYNKGQKGNRMSPATEFKKGCTPHNYRLVGSERINKDGYVEVKVAEPNRWKAKHRAIFEAAHGEIPEGCRVLFADGDKQNFALENLVLVPANKVGIINRMGIPYVDAETLDSAVTLASLISAVSARQKGANARKTKETQ
jgi:hypothetical protein